MGKPGEVHVDLSPIQWAHVKAALEGQIATSVAYAGDLERENARLQERVEDAEALAERRKKEIIKSGEDCRYCGRWHHFGCRHLELSSKRSRCPHYPCSVRCKDARAAIEEGTPPIG